jgi:hypothetical protein
MGKNKSYIKFLNVQYLLYLLVIPGFVLGSFIASQKNNSPLKEVSNAAPTIKPLNLMESLDIDQQGPYVKRSQVYRDALSARPNYRYLAEETKTDFPEIEFGDAIVQRGNAFEAGKSPEDRRLQNLRSAGVQAIDWHNGNPRYFRDLLQNTSVDGTATRQYQVTPAEALGKGYFFIYDKNGATSLDCSASNLYRYSLSAGAASGYYTMSPGGAGLPANSDDHPIYYRFGRGKVNYFSSSSGYVSAIVETRVYFDNVCAFGSNDKIGDDEDEAANQSLVNVSFPIQAFVVFNPGTKAWKTLFMSQSIYRAYLLHVGGARFDALFYSATDGFTLDLNSTIRIHAPDGYPSAVFDYTHWRHAYPSYDHGGGGNEGGVYFGGIRDIFGTPVIVDSIRLVTRTDCVGSGCGFKARQSMSVFDPVIKQDALYLTFFPYWARGGKGFVARFRSVDEIPNVANYEAGYVQTKIDYTIRFGEHLLQCFTIPNTPNPGDWFFRGNPDEVKEPCYQNRLNAIGGTVLAQSRAALKPAGSGNYLKYDTSASPQSGLLACDAGNSCTNYSVADAYKFKVPGRSTPVTASALGGSFTADDKNIIALADNVADRIIYIGGEDFSLVENQCLSMYWPGNQNSIDLGPGQSALLTLDALPPSLSGDVAFNFYDKDNGKAAIPGSLSSPLSNVGSVSRATITITYDYLNLTLKKKNFQINGIIPLGSNDPNCVVSVRILFPPTVNPNPGTLSATCGSTTTPYSIKFSVSTVSYENTIRTNRAYLLPKSATASIINGYGTAPSIIIDASPANVVLGYGATYSKQQFLLGQTSYWDFTLTFDSSLSGSNSYSPFYASGGFDLFLYIEDQTGNNLVNGRIPKATSFVSVDPFQCAKPYYKTYGGDYRSNEKSTGTGNTGYGTVGQATNKFWQPITAPWGRISALQNNNAVTGISQSMSSYSAEIVEGASNSCANSSTLTTLGSGFCSTVVDLTGINHGDVMNQLNTNISKATTTLGTLNKIDIIDSNRNVNVPNTYNNGNPKPIVISGSYATINLGLLSAAYSPLLVEIPFGSTVNNVTVIDDVNTNPASIENVIIWCRTANCVLNVNSVKTFAATSVGMSGSKLSFPTSTFVKDKSRLYLNYNYSDEPSIYSLTTGRKTYLQGVSGSQSNLYLGGFITDGYFYSDQGSSTAIVKGLVIARGIIARDTMANTSDPFRNKHMFFKDFPEPFLYLDFDAKFQVVYRGLLVKPPEEVDRKYLGL